MTPIALEAGTGSGAGAALLLALLLGLRHATDPDHVAALVTLAADPQRGGARAATRLGIAWGLGHALTCFALGLAVVAVGTALPPLVAQGAEVLVGLLIVALALRLLWRWWRGRFHAHPHRHGEIIHSHPHLHELAWHGKEPGEGHAEHEPHVHRHATGMGRSPGEAFAIGLVHGVGGSALGAALLAAAGGAPGRAIAVLLCFAGGTALAMAVVSGALGLTFDRAPRALFLERATPALAVLTLSFGLWYVGMALAQLAAAT